MASLRALVCDDYSMVRETIRPLLVEAGFDIVREACIDAGASAYVDKGDLQALDEVLRRAANKSPLGRITP